MSSETVVCRNTANFANSRCSASVTLTMNILIRFLRTRRSICFTYTVSSIIFRNLAVEIRERIAMGGDARFVV